MVYCGVRICSDSSSRSTMRLLMFEISADSCVTCSITPLVDDLTISNVDSEISSLLYCIFASKSSILAELSCSLSSESLFSRLPLISVSVSSSDASFVLYFSWMISASSFMSSFSATMSIRALRRRSVSCFSRMSLCESSLHFGMKMTTSS